MVLIFMVMAMFGCETYRIEHHRRSSIFLNPNYVENTQREVTLEDGTVLVFESVNTQSTYGRKGGQRTESFKIREELEDGEIVLRALLPQHVLVNLLACLRHNWGLKKSISSV